MLRTLIIASLIYCTALTATAQQTGAPPTSQEIVNSKPTPAWPQVLPFTPHEIKVVTLDRPGIRQRCYVRELTAGTLTCESLHHHQTTTYRRDDIAALLDPPSHHDRNLMLIPVALMVVSLAASFFVPLPFSITLRVFSFLFFCAFGAMGIGAAGDRDNDILLYQRPNTPLTIQLRTH